jgi:hypothetical protein
MPFVGKRKGAVCAAFSFTDIFDLIRCLFFAVVLVTTSNAQIFKEISPAAKQKIEQKSVQTIENSTMESQRRA